MVLPVENLHEKTSRKGKTGEILHLYYMRMHSFSANQKQVIFSCTLLKVNLLIHKTQACQNPESLLVNIKYLEFLLHLQSNSPNSDGYEVVTKLSHKCDLACQ